MSQMGQFLSPRMGQLEQIHFVGIGGVGMCGIAEVLHHQGYRITGSDLSESSTVLRLKSLGIKVYQGHRAEHIQGCDVVVRSSAVDLSNPEIQAASQLKIPVIPRAAMLAELMRFKYGIAIAGTHGKTTTTSLVSSVLEEGGLDPSFVIGGKLNHCGVNAQVGKSPYFVVEADESDASFLFLKPMMAVVTNIDADHMDTYGGDFNKLRTTFLEFLHHLPFYGSAVVCLEDEELCGLLPSIQRPTLTYGFKEEAQYRAVDWTQKGMSSEFTVIRPKGHAPLHIQFSCPGRHNVLNALAAIAIATQLQVDDRAIESGLKKFQGVGRRFQLLGEKQFKKGKAMLVDDYGHHPQEIRATVEALRRVWPNQRLIHVFQPHRYTRTQSLYNEFVDVLSASEELLLFDIYSAGELPIVGVSSEQLAKDIQSKGARVTLINEQSILERLDELIQENDVVLMQGAGSIGQVAINVATTRDKSQEKIV